MPDTRNAEAAPAPDLWRLGPAENPVTVENADPLLPFLPYFLAGWKLEWAGPAAPGMDADVRVIETGEDGYRIVSQGPGGADFAFDNPYDAANGLAGALISVHVARLPETICLHAGASLVGGGLVLLLGDSLAGKSSVALQLAVLGNRLFGDDQIAVRLGAPPVGICLGLTPKVRTPLPADAGPAFHQFVEEYTSMEGEGQRYLKLWDREAGSFGETAPVRALLFLDRVPEGDAALSDASRADVVKSMVETAFAPHLASERLISGLTALAGGAALHRLRFSSSREAAALVSTRFRAVAS